MPASVFCWRLCSEAFPSWLVLIPEKEFGFQLECSNAGLPQAALPRYYWPLPSGRLKFRFPESWGSFQEERMRLKSPLNQHYPDFTTRRKHCTPKTGPLLRWALGNGVTKPPVWSEFSQESEALGCHSLCLEAEFPLLRRTSVFSLWAFN